MLIPVCLCILVALFCGLPEACGAQSVARIISIQGDGQFRHADEAEWAAAEIQQGLLAGNFVRTLEYSRMGLLFLDRTQLRLNEKTILQIKDVADQTRLRLESGRAWTKSGTMPHKLYMETPSATAAIRGTDWDLEVDEDGRALLTVLSGEVEFFNDLGRLVVRQNESAEARIGQPPTKLIFVHPRDRVQWVTAYSVDPLRHIVLSGDKGDELEEALASAPPAKKGRILADLGRWREAGGIFNATTMADPIGAGYAALRRGSTVEAQRCFDRVSAPQGRDRELLELGRVSLAIAREDFGRAFTSLTALTREGTLSQPAPFLLLADLMVYAGDLEKSMDYLGQGLDRFPNDAKLHSALARTYLLADEGDKSREAIASALRINKRSVEAALVEGDLAHAEGDARSARRAYERAIDARPGDDRGWYGLGRVNTEKEVIQAGRDNLLKALELYPRGAGYQGELGTLESLANNFAESRAAFDEALEQNPDDYVALTGLGLLELKRGNTEAALDAFLRASLMEPRYARVHVYMAVAYYQMGQVQESLEELKRASQLDEKDPMPHFMASIIHTDTMRPGLAIESARTALHLLPYLKSLNQLANDKQGLTNLGYAFSYLGMEEWAQRYAQDSYYPFWAGSHLFLADSYFGLFNKNSELFQGFLSDPTVFGSSNRFQTLIPKPVTNFSASVRATTAHDLVTGVSPQIQASGFANSVAPFAYFVDHERFDLDFEEGPYDLNTTTVAFGLTPRHDLGMFVFADQSNLNADYTASSYVLRDDLDSIRADFGMHYKFLPDSHLWLKAGLFTSQDDVEGTLLGTPVASDVNVWQPEWGLRHTFAAGSNHEITLGFEKGDRKTSSDFLFNLGFLPIILYSDFNYSERSLDAFISDRWRVTPNLMVQGDLFYQHHHRSATYSDYALFDYSLFEQAKLFPSRPLLSVFGQEDLSQNRFNPRVGVVYRFNDGPQVRLAYQRWLRPSLFSSLGPVATAGIPLDDRLVMRGGELTRVRSQFEWEFSKKSFVSAFLDYKEVDNNRFKLTPFTLSELESLAKLRPRRMSSLANDDMLEFVDTPEYDGGKIRSAGISLNHLLTDEWGLFGRYTATSSTNTGTTFSGNQVPYLPLHMFALGATWVEPSGWYFISRMVYRSSRYRDEANLVPLDSGWSGAFDLFWQSKDRHLLFRVSADNAFDKNNPTQYTAEISFRF